MACCYTARGQHDKPILPKSDSLLIKSDSLLRALDEMLGSSDSVSLLRLIDSIMHLPDIKEKSQMAVRLGYNSNVVATGRTIGLNQFGLSPGISYYHKSGLYADLSAYWSKQYDPDLYLSVASAGYMKTISRRWSILAEYSHYFYTATDSATYYPYTNNLGLSNYVTFKPVSLRLDYYYYFGKKNAQRIQPGIMVNLEKKKWLKMDRILFFPSFNVLFGSENVVTDYHFYPDYLQRYRKNQSLPPAQQLPLYYPVSETVFGVMNYSFVAPLSITKKNWTLLISYTYNIPKSLPHEDLGLTPSGYMSASITRYFGF
jgi:hypothetical protein